VGLIRNALYQTALMCSLIGCQDYSVPAHIQEHIDLIKPTIQFNPHAAAPRGKKRAVNHPVSTLKTNGVKVNKQATLSTCDEIITPDCLRALYNFHYTPRETEKNSFGIGASITC
jgi:tripeptidyl-peptidase-1